MGICGYIGCGILCRLCFKTNNLPRLYRNDINKVFFYHEKAPIHPSKVTMATYKRLSKSLGFLLSITRIYLSKLQMVVRLIFLALVFLNKGLQSEEPKNWMVFGKFAMIKINNNKEW